MSSFPLPLWLVTLQVVATLWVVATLQMVAMLQVVVTLWVVAAPTAWVPKWTELPLTCVG